MAAMEPKVRARSRTAPRSALMVSQAAPWVTSMATESRPQTRVKGVKRPKKVPV